MSIVDQVLWQVTGNYKLVMRSNATRVAQGPGRQGPPTMFLTKSTMQDIVVAEYKSLMNASRLMN